MSSGKPESVFLPREIAPSTPVRGLTVVLSPATSGPVMGWIESLPSEVRSSLTITDADGADEAIQAHLLLAGDCETHPWIRRLYHEGWLCTDARRPGPEAFELKTLCGAWSPLHNVILAGASDEAGIRSGLGRLGALMTTYPDLVPCLFEVSPATPHGEHPDPAGSSPELAAGEAEAQEPSRCLEELIALGARAVHRADLAAANQFRQRLLARIGTHAAPDIDAAIVILFRILEGLPVWSDPDRARVVAAFHRFLHGPDGLPLLGTWLASASHSSGRCLPCVVSRSALAAYFVADYFRRFYNLPDTGAWRRQVDDVFRGPMCRIKPASDASGPQWAVTVQNAAIYALASGHTEYFDDGVFAETVKRAIQCFTNQGQMATVGGIGGRGWAPWTLFAMAAMECQDGSFLAPFTFWDPGQTLLDQPWACGVEPIRSFASRIPAAQDPDLTGLTISRLEPAFADPSVAGHTGSTHGMSPAPSTFDKISFRSGFRREDDYLLLDGVAGGEDSYEDVNCIKEMQMKGFPWVCALDAGLRETGIGAQNGLLVLRNGQRSAIPPVAELLDSSCWAGGGFTITRVRNYSGAHWTRSVFWRASGFTLVIDEIEVVEPGRFQMEARWFCLGRYEEGRWPSFELGDTPSQVARFGVGWDDTVAAEIDALDYSDEFYSYYREPNMSRRELYPWCRVPPVVHRIRLRKVFDGQPGQRASIATRFVCTTPGSDLRREFSLERDTTVIFVEVPGSQVEEFPFANEVKAISFESAIAEDTGGTLHPFRPTASAGQGDVLLAGFEDGRCMAVDVRRGETPWHQALDGRVNAAVSLAYGGRGYFFVGTEEGLLACLDTEGSVVWRHEIDYPAQDVAEKLESRWSSHQPAVRALAVGMTPNGPLLVAGFGDHHIYRIDPFSGDVLWELPLARGSASHLLIDDLERDGSPRIVVGLGSPAGDGAATVVSPDGDFLGRLATPFDASPWATSQTTALLAVDLDGDGGSEIIKAAATPIEQVSCWKKGELEWTVDVGEWPAAVACLPGRVLLVGSRSGWVFLIDPAGQIQFRDFLGESVRCAVACDGHFIVGGRSGGLYEIDAGCGQSSLLRRFSSSVERVHSAGPLVALMESGEIFIG